MPSFLGGLVGLLLGLFLGGVAAAASGAVIMPWLPGLLWLAGPVSAVAGVLGFTGAGAVFIIIVFIFLLTWVLYLISNAILTIPVPASGGSVAIRVTSIPGEQFIRGVLIGMAAGINFVFWMVMPLPSTVILMILALIPWLACIPPVALSPVFQTLVAWIGWTQPLTFVASYIGGPIAGVLYPIAIGQSGFNTLRFDVTTASFEVSVNLSAISTAEGFSIGHFNFINSGVVTRTSFSGVGISAHETGHVLNTCVFGALFLGVNGIDENIVPGRGLDSLGEFYAESHIIPGPAWKFIGFWSP